MQKKILFIVLAWALVGCNSTSKKDAESVSSKQDVGKRFFDYDQIDYYLSDFNNNGDFQELESAAYKSEIDSLKAEILLGITPQNISDTSFVEKLGKMGFKKTALDKTIFSEIDQFFVEKNAKENLSTACIYIYRHILVFKKNEKIIGIAKICFGCMAHMITGTTANTNNFGQDGDYGRLQKILHK